MLARRSIQLLLNESRAYLSLEQREKLVHRLNGDARNSIDAEWELIILAALASAGDVEHEPDLGGAARLDIRFRSPCLQFVGDVRAVSDEIQHSENPVHQLSAEFGKINKELRSEGIKGSLDFRVNGVEAAVWKGEYKTRLILPWPHEFRGFIFDARFDDFLAAIRREPAKVHHHVVENERASVSIVFNPGGVGIRYYTHPPYNVAHDPVRNSIYGALERKSRQIKHAGERMPDELAGVILCDGGCAMFRNSSGIGTTLDRIMATFLRSSKTVDFVCVVDVRLPGSTEQLKSQLQFEARVWSMLNEAFDHSVEDLFNQALGTLPAPVQTAVDTMNHLNRAAKKLPRRVFANCMRNGSMSANSLEISLRAAMDYLAGRIDRPAFERIVHPDWLALLRQNLSRGRSVSNVSVARYPGTDDDGLIITFGGYDAAAAPFQPQQTDNDSR